MQSCQSENNTKQCTKCNACKMPYEFYKRKNGKDGLSSVCSECDRKKQAKHRSSDSYREFNRKRMKNEYGAAFKKWAQNDRKNNPLKYQVMDQNSRAREQGIVGTITTQDWMDVLRENRNRCAACLSRDKKLCIDHVIPVYFDGKNTRENIQPLCRSCNSKKWIRTVLYLNGAEVSPPEDFKKTEDIESFFESFHQMIANDQIIIRDERV